MIEREGTREKEEGRRKWEMEKWENGKMKKIRDMCRSDVVTKMMK